MDREAWWATVDGVARVGHELATKQQEEQHLFLLYYYYFFFINFCPQLLLIWTWNSGKRLRFVVLRPRTMSQNIIYTFCFVLWLHWIFTAARGLLVAMSMGYSFLQRVGFSLRWVLLFQSTGSRACGLSSCSSQALECRLSSCGAGFVPCGVWNLPEPGMEPMSPALVGDYLPMDHKAPIYMFCSF